MPSFAFFVLARLISGALLLKLGLLEKSCLEIALSAGERPGLELELEVALLRQALLSATAATNVAFEALLEVSKTANSDRRSELLQVVGRGMEELNEALAYIKEAQDVRLGS